MLEKCYIGIDTSNYTTSAAVVNEAGAVLANLKSPLPVKEGNRGLRQSDALFAHVKNTPWLMDELSHALADKEIKAIGVSAKPRDAEDSYMPCFLAGVATAHALAAAKGLPVYSFSHQNGHIRAAAYSADFPCSDGNVPFGAFHVSGGTTEMLYVTPNREGFSVSLIGESLDLHAGQAVDRIGVLLGLSFPCGPALEELAASNMQKVPRPRISAEKGNCHLSGLENMATKLYHETGDRALTAAFVLDFLAESLCAMACYLRQAHPTLPLLFAGGVMSNRRIATILRERLGSNVYFAAPAFSTDNATGVALLCREKFLKDNG